MAAWWLRFDMRCQPGDDVAERYRSALELAEFADQNGVDTILVSEHHGVDDGYLPSPFVLAGALAAVTTRARLVVSALVLGLHDPVRAAEDALVVDQLSAGRLSIVAALGYRRADFALFGLDLANRVELLERKLPIFRDALHGRAIATSVGPVIVSPTAAQDPGPPVLLGGAVPAAARRAARLGDGFWPMRHDPVLVAAYRHECLALGRRVGTVIRPPTASAVFVAEDTERAWVTLAPFLGHELASYSSWAAETGAPTSYGTAGGGRVDWDAESIRASGRYEILTPEQCVVRMAGDEPLMLHPLVGGCPVDVAHEGLQLFVDRVVKPMSKSA